MHIPTLRLYSVYGPFEEPKRLMPSLINAGLKKSYPPLVNPDIARDYIFVEDVCQVFEQAALTKTRELGPVYNLGTGVQTKMEELVCLAQRLFDINASPQWGTMPDRSWDTSIWVADISKLKKDFGWTPQTNLEFGIKKMIMWQKENYQI